MWGIRRGVRGFDRLPVLNKMTLPAIARKEGTPLVPVALHLADWVPVTGRYGDDDLRFSSIRRDDPHYGSVAQARSDRFKISHPRGGVGIAQSHRHHDGVNADNRKVHRVATVPSMQRPDMPCAGRHRLSSRDTEAGGLPDCSTLVSPSGHVSLHTDYLEGQMRNGPRLPSDPAHHPGELGCC